MSLIPEKRCVVCEIASAQLMRCSRCKNPRYLVCSKECQRSDWSEHKLYCDIDNASPKNPTSFSDTILVNVLNPGHKLCYIYTHGEHSKGRPELLAVDVPVQKRLAVEKILMGLSGNSSQGKVRDCFKAEFYGYHVIILDVTHEHHRKALVKCMERSSPSQKIFLVKPFFDEWEQTLPVPGDKIDLQQAIIGKWYAWFFAHEDSALALELVFRSGKCWECDLTAKEVKFVRNNWEHTVREAVGEYFGLPHYAAADYIETVAMNLRLASQRYQEGIKVADGNYTWDFLGDRA
jgi:MYND finger